MKAVGNNVLGTFDLSSDILGQKDSYSGLSDPTGWIVVAECSESPHPKNSTVTVGILPIAQVTPSIRRKALAHGFDRLIAVQCTKP